MVKTNDKSVKQDLEEISQKLAKNPEAMDNISPELLDTVIERSPRLKAEITSKTWKGPIPSPEDLKAIDEAVPGSGEKIVDAGIRSMDVQNQLNKRAALYTILTLLIAGLIATLLIVFGFILIYKGKNISGSLFASAPLIVSLVGLFIIHNKKE